MSKKINISILMVALSFVSMASLAAGFGVAGNQTAQQPTAPKANQQNAQSEAINQLLAQTGTQPAVTTTVTISTQRLQRNARRRCLLT